MVKIVVFKPPLRDVGLGLGMALLLAWSSLLTRVVCAHSAEASSRAAADREEQQLSLQPLGLSYQSIHRMLRDENEPTSFRGELRYQQKRFIQTRQKRELNAPANRLNLTNRGLREYNSSSGQWKGDLQVITSIDLSNNRLSRLSIDHFQQLRQLDVSNNSLSGIPLSLADTSPALPLVSLDLSCNQFSRLSSNFFAQRLPQLRHLNLAHNRLGNVSRETFYNLLELQTLLLSHNSISDIDYETFLALPNLQHLDLSHNRLRGSAIRALQGIPDLVSLSIAHNPQVGVAMQEFVASWSLKELDASGTGLCQVPAALAQSVRTLKLSDNWFQAINCGDMDSYPLLQYLDLSHSRIAHVEDDALGRLELLEFLFLDHNLLTRVPGSLPTSLEHLFLQNNQIMELPPQSFAGLTNLQTLDVSGNRLIFLPALALPKLLTLNLQSSGVESVSQSIVHTLPQLRDLLLEDNPIICSDLLGIAEWASPCRAVDVGQPRGKIDLKQQYLQFHDFYENFSSQCGRRLVLQGSEDDKSPPTCSLTTKAAATATTTQGTMPKVKESKAQGTTAGTEATTKQSAGNNIAQLTTKTLRPTETTSLAKIQQQQEQQQQQRQQQMPGMPTEATTSPSLPTLAQTKATTAVPILAMPAATATATGTRATATTAMNSDEQMLQPQTATKPMGLTLPTNISDSATTAAATAALTTAIEVPQTISASASQKSDKMPAQERTDDKADDTILKYSAKAKAAATTTTQMAASDTSGQAATVAPHKHPTLQLHIKDRHLIGTPLLMHKGDVLLVDAEQLLLPGTATVADADAEHRRQLDDSQHQRRQQEQESRQTSSDKRQPEAINGDTKSPTKTKKKPSLSIKKMTYSTKHAATKMPPLPTAMPMPTTPRTQHQHSSVNTPKDAAMEELSTFAQLKAYVELKSESKPEHLLDQRLEGQQTLSSSHPGAMLLLACVLVVVLLAGLAHVYRCELPWQRRGRPGQMRPHHQRQFNESDDAHSFLNYQGSTGSTADPARLQKWHHSTRREAPYSSPLHNLQARELQRQQDRLQRCQQFYSASLASSASSGSSRSSLQSPCHEDSYSIEMAPSSPPAVLGLDGAVPSLPMELLSSRNSRRDAGADRVAATDLGGETLPVIKSVSSRLMAPSSRRLGIW
ncbi:uncharacterized protein 2mit [Drosophila pseudoobscura]|uniref:Uncharacterized protein 2mit n=1 Tax=Drosophila pseudoobscura pseudoobscura TaxID=46245 RepID=A0A6I8VVH1_DROPS|nr:uncharacterized protein LOC4801394 [Drosophila pseudoobscura]XP_033235082.1 uncharacterized protein LOC4801394 [Drosophila pseudoobscura]XP_033235083.1 uncharacterized protein LOC4801394 [Drosophila pseudoobscura]